ncbi:MAG: tRNA lysidine(34) synthetase TilS [Eubacteriales bacterium]
MIDKIKRAILEDKLIVPRDKVVVGVSGGPDSICMLHLLINLREEFNFEIFCVHINHMIRGLDSDMDEKYVENFCVENMIPLDIYRFNIPKIAKEKKISSEEAGRLSRYEAFEDAGIKHGCNKIALAHNKNDQAETLLMRLFRGTSPRGLACMESMRDGRFIRPLLGITRTEIERYCSVNKLNPCIDKSNLEPSYTRNKIRLELIPYLEKNYNENLVDSLFRLSKIAGEEKSYFNMIVEEFVSKHVELNKDMDKILQADFNMEIFNQEHPTIRKKILIHLAEAFDKAENISYANLETAVKFLQDGKTSKKFELPNSLYISIAYGKVTIKSSEDEENNAYEVKDVGRLIEKVVDIKDVQNLKSKEHVKYFDYDAILASNLRIKLRNRRAGDYIKPLGMNGTKTIKDLFIDTKIPKDDRDSIMLVCLGSEVIWIIGSQINENFKITDKTKRAMMLEYKIET